jgi:alpha-ketoglutarate-dependent taurine dioxygenase
MVREWPDPVVEFRHPDTGGTIRFVGDGFVLNWTDYVANDWEETFPTLSTAVARLAVLMRCGETDWEVGFEQDAPIFFRSATTFLDREVGS